MTETIAIILGGGLLFATVMYLICAKLLPWLDKNERGEE